MNGLVIFLVYLVCSCCLISEGEAALSDPCTDNANCTTTTASSECNGTVCVCVSSFVTSYDSLSCEIETTLGGSCTVNAACTSQNTVCNGTTSGSTCICASGYVTTGSSCEAEATLGGTCTVNAACTTQNTVCNGTTSGSTCVCESGFVTTGSSCEAEATLGGSCTVSAACTTQNSVCNGTTSGNTCVCESGYVTTGSSCEAETTLGGSCTVNAACTTQNTVCSGICVCASGYVTTGSSCKAEAILDGSCTVNAACTTQNTVCSGTTSGSTCICASKYVTTGSSCEAEAILGGSCTVNAACTTQNTVCSGTTSGSTCICASGYVTTGSSCEAEVILGGSCTVNAACTTQNTVCSGTTSGSTCICASSYVTTGSSCEAEAILGGSCTVNAACTTQNTVCSGTTSGSTCICASGYVTTGSSCEAETTLGGSCTVNAACTTQNTVCSGICVCASGYVTTGSSCKAEAILDGSCTVNAACTTQNTVCSGTTSGSTCICASKYVTTGSSCEAEAILGGSCTVNAACTTQNTVCSGTTSGSTCICASGYVTTGSSCEAEVILGGSCTVNAACTTQNTVCSGTTSGSTCICASSYVTTGSSCEAEAILGGSCTVNAACTTQNTVCSGTTSGSTCICASGYVTTGSSCEAETTLGGSCTVNAACTTQNTVCSGICVCASGYVTTGSSCKAEAILDGSCTVNAACTTQNTVCSGTTSGSTCICASKYVTTGSSCEAEAILGGSCTVNAACTTQNTVCSGTTSGSTCICASGYVTTGSSCEAEVILGGSCTVNAACTTQNTVCSGTTSGSTCICASSYVTTGSSCEAEAILGGSCTVNAACTTQNTVCSGTTSGSTCICASGYVTTGSSCEAELGTTCSTTEACADNNAICSGVCECNPASHYDSDRPGNIGGTCISLIDLGGTCPSTVADTAPCSDSNATCTSGACQCTSAYFDNNGVGTGNTGGMCVKKNSLGAYCPVPTDEVSESDTCLDGNSRCVMEDGNYLCKCVDSHYNDNGTCRQKKSLEETCPGSLPNTVSCADPNSVCTQTGSTEYTCRCNDAYYDNREESFRACEKKKSLEETCPGSLPNTVSCADPNSVCNQTGSTEYTCRCNDAYYDNKEESFRACEKKVDLGSDCSMTEACRTSDAVCEGSKCICDEDSYDDNGDNLKGSCITKVRLNQQCVYSTTVTDQCVDVNAYCYAISRTCICKSDYSTSGGICNPNQPVGGACNTQSSGASCSDSNADCYGNVCICKDGFYDDNGPSYRGDCRDMEELKVSGPFLSNPQTDRFTVKWTAPSRNQHVSGYTVQWQPKNSNTVDGGSVDVGNNTVFVVTSGVTAGRTYTITVISRNEDTQVNSPRTVLSETKEQAAKPNTPGNLIRGSSNFDAADKEIYLVWQAQAGFVSEYSVKLFEGTEELKSSTFLSTQGKFYYNSMLNGHRYKISVTALSESFDNGNNVSSDANVEEIKTVVKEPGPPRDVNCVEESVEAIRLTWLPPNPDTANGDIIQYHITVKKLDSTTYANHKTGSSETNMYIGGLQPGSYYIFEIITENELYNSSTKGSTTSFCTTKASTSDPPNAFTIADVTSRSIAFEWSDPVVTNSEENLGYVIQVKETDDCAVETIYGCSDCVKTFTLSDLSDLCNNQGSITDRAKAGLRGKQVYNATDLLPDTEYSVIVAAINLAGRGQAATVTQTTNEEVPAKPEIDSISSITATSFTLKWSLADPRPGKTNYTINVTADPPAQTKTITVSGFEIRTQQIMELEENWPYTVSISARTSVGSHISDLQKIITEPSAPGQVSNFTVDMTPGGSYDQWKVTWKIPGVLERNSNITSYKIKHNGTSTPPEKMINAEAESYTYEETVGVVPENFYSIEVFAINNKGQDGASVSYIKEALAGVPEPPVETDFAVIKAETVQPSRTTIKMTVERDFLELSSRGSVRSTGLICSDKAKMDQIATLSESLSDGYTVMTLEAFDTMDNWYFSEKNAFSPWRVTRPEWVAEVDGQATGRRKRAAGDDILFTIGVEQCDSADQTGYCNGPLVEDTEFIVFVVVCTNGGCLVSQPSGPYRTEPVPEDKPPIGMIVGVVVAVVVVIALVLIILLFMIRRRRRNENPMKRVDEELPRMDPTIQNIPRKRPLRLREFTEHLEKMHKDSNLLFSSEYEDIKTLSAAHSQDAANREENRLKNRYINILPFDHSLVKLSSNGEDDGQDYINANYLPGYKSRREYIGCQGPIPGTIDDYWRMVWEQNVSVIVMLTLCKEGQKVKCEQYWPDAVKEPKQYGDIIVEVTNYSNIKTYDYRIFNLTVGNKTMIVKHFHFLSWMDFSANVQTGIMIDFIKQVRGHVQPPDTAGPIIVHCSAGVGRTGTYISLDHLMQFVDDHDVDEALVDIFAMVLALRENRPHMVQTEQQYIFIHDCLKELIERKNQQIYQNLGFENDDENLYQNQQDALYENVQIGGEPRTNL